MKIDKAIKNLTAGREDCGMIPEGEYTQTIDLATEALKWIQFHRRISPDRVCKKLPGETVEK